MSFTLSNNKGSVCHIIVWKEEIPRIEANLLLNSIVCINGFEYATFERNGFNKGNHQYEFIIRKNTTFTILKQTRIICQLPKKEIKLISSDNLKNEYGHISKFTISYIFII